MLWRVISLCIVTLLSVGDASTQERAPRNAIDRAQALLRTEDFANAKRALEKLEKDEARLRGKDNVDYARILAMLGRAQAETNQAAPAVANISHALDILRSRRAPDAEISSAEHALARAFLNQERSTEARPMLERIVERSNANKSAVSRLTAADALRDLGHIAVAEEDWQRGVSLLSRALQLLEREFGGDDARVIPVLNDLGIAEGKLGKPALPRFEKARSIAMSKKLFGAEAVALERMTELLEQTDGATARTTLESACKLLSIYFTLTYEHLNLRRWEDARPALKNLVGLAQRLDIAGCQGITDVTFFAIGFGRLGADLINLGLQEEAIELLRFSAASWEIIEGEAGDETILSLGNLGLAYRQLGRLEEAERLYLRVLKLEEGLADSEYKARQLATLWNNLGQIYVEQGSISASFERGKEAEEKWKEGEQAYRRSLSLIDSVLKNNQRAKKDDLRIRSKAVFLGNLAMVLILLNREQESVTVAEESLSVFESFNRADDPSIFTTIIPIIHNALLKKKYNQAESLALRAIAIREAAQGPDDAEVATLLGHLRDARVGLGKIKGAYDASKRATEILIRRSSRASLPQSSEVAESYFEYAGHIQSAYLLSQHAPSSLSALRDEAFGTAQRLMASNTASALLQSVSRQAQGTGKLADLVRERQDRLIDITALEKLLASELARPSSERSDKQGTELARKIVDNRARIAEIDSKLTREFPRFADLGVQQPVSIEQAQELLADDEALVLIEGSEQDTFVWVLTRRDAAWTQVPIHRREASTLVQALRCGLDEEEWNGVTRAAQCGQLLGFPDALSDDRPLPFDLDLAHTVYLSLFGPFQDVLMGKRLIVVASGPLTSLPFHVLVTQKPKTAIPTTFEDYRGVPWMVRSHAITVLPSVTSLNALRAQSSKRPRAPEDYIGIGNPVLQGTRGECREATVPDQCPAVGVQIAMADVGRATIRSGRGRRNATKRISQVFADGSQTEELLKQVRSLCPLPDTSYELACVRKQFQYSALYDLANASEVNLRKLNADGTLARYRIVHFATHGLVAGDLEGPAQRKSEPALVLTPPERPLDADDDGLLTASEVAQLRLNADWVVLSACSTAAGNSSNAEALSGLARAFFYAGTRALLVSHWPVYSDAAVLLTTRTFAELDRDPGSGRAEAFRRAMLALMDDRSKASNAHPTVWAPFVIVGEGGVDEPTIAASPSAILPQKVPPVRP